MIYTILLDGEILFHPNLQQLKITNPILELEQNGLSSFTFNIDESNPRYKEIKPHKSIVEVRGNELLFYGRVLEITDDFYNGHKVYCESAVGYLCDSNINAYTYQGNVKGLLEKLIQEHNSQVEEEKQFQVGNVTVIDPNDYINRSDTQYLSTWKNIKNKLIESLGGYIQLRVVDGVKYIDYLDTFPTANLQKIEFSKNLLSVKKTKSYADIATVIKPLGIKNEEGIRLNISSVNEGKDTIEDEEAIKKYGRIVKTVIYDDVTEPSNLLRKGRNDLLEAVKMTYSISVNAIDLAEKGIPNFTINKKIGVISKYHDIDDYFVAEKMKINLLNPIDNKIELNSVAKTLTDESNDLVTNNNTMIEIVENVKNDYTINVPQKITEVKKELTSAIEQSSKEIHLMVSEKIENQEEKIGNLEMSVDNITLEVSKAAEQVYRFESGHGNIYENTYQFISKGADNKEVISSTNMNLGINMDFMQDKDICISVLVEVKNGVEGSLGGYVGAEFDVEFADKTKETYATRFYVGQSHFQYLLATGSTNFKQRIYTHYKLPNKQITYVSNLKIIINLNADFAYVSNPKVEFGTFPTGYDFELPYIRDNVTTLTNEFTSIKQEVNELSLQAVSIVEEITTVKGEVTKATERLQSAEIKLQPSNILLAENEKIVTVGKLHTTKFSLDKDGVHISSGGLDISNNTGDRVFYADTNGNLILKGTIYATNGEFSGKIAWASIESADINIKENARIGNCLYLGSVTDKSTLRYISLNGSIPVPNSEISGDLLVFDKNEVSLMGENAVSIATDSGMTAVVASDSKVNIYAPLGLYVNGNKIA